LAKGREQSRQNRHQHGRASRLVPDFQSALRLRIISGPDQGPADALNKAFALARGTLIGWLNADDISPPGALARAVQALASNPQWLMVYGEGEEFDLSTGQRQRYPTVQPQVGLAGFRSHCFICQPTVVFRRTMGLLLGPFNQHWRTAFDFDYWLRAFAAFPERIGYIPTLQGLTRVHGATITSRQRAQVALEATALARHFGHAPSARLHAYALELQLGVAQLPPETSLADHLAEVFAQAKPWLTPADFGQLQHDWLLNPRSAPAQQTAERAAAVLPAHPAVPLLQIVQPHLRPGQPGPPAGPQLRLQAAFAKAMPHTPLLQQEQAFQDLLQRRAAGTNASPLPFGVNLIHAPRSSTEDQLFVEALITALHAAKVPLALREPSQAPGPYALNLIALSPPAHAQWWLSHGLAPHHERLEVAVWPWIAGGWPEAWAALLPLVDEVWAPSGLVQAALGDGGLPPVWSLPGLPLPRGLLEARPDCALSAPTVVMLADLQHSPHLINSFAAVEVFRQAFPLLSGTSSSAQQSSPQLLILVENATAADPEWLWLQACAAHDPRLQLHSIDALPLRERLALIQGADVVLSLQRSYALPSLLAAAQAMGLQVIATAFGAALDLPASPNLHRVPARSVPIGRGACSDGEGFSWGEPDRDAAVVVLQAAVRAGRCTPVQDCESNAMSAPAQIEARLRQLWEAHRTA